MSTTELVKLSAAEMAAKIKAKEVSSRELVEAHLAVIESAEPSVKAFLKVSADQALEQAALAPVLRNVLRVPLHADPVAVVALLDRLHDTGRLARHDR